MDHRDLHPACLRSLRLRGDNRFLRPPDLLAPKRWLRATVGDFSDSDIALRLALHALPHPGHPTSSQPVCIASGSRDLSLSHHYWSCSAARHLIRKANVGVFCQRLLQENASFRYHAENMAETIVLRDLTMPITHFISQSPLRELDSAQLQAQNVGELMRTPKDQFLEEIDEIYVQLIPYQDLRKKKVLQKSKNNLTLNHLHLPRARRLQPQLEPDAED
ncbi:hypothetical protein LAZ67_2006401 [Cordylochernes scorpioides]|uniref:Uncharacterized protein n=1 Tax=Cordylochernes scorpioides TaxID=51811 RepID=A0ABY6K9W5_9ARAC|nr:hypothetical protein LAZ67_2006401 [Cordylochernes scorpioides]